MAHFSSWVFLFICVATITVYVNGQKDTCFWSGTAPFCRPKCSAGYLIARVDPRGTGSKCRTGVKHLCCLPGSPSLNSLDKSSRCYWAGTAPFCRGTCPKGFTAIESSKKGDGKRCLFGSKKYCCPVQSI